jgi:prepilin signal peptidase PulO-like enzyme (type II secretory pathway)
MNGRTLIELAAMFLLGSSAGTLINAAVYRLAWTPRPFSPWAPGPSAGRRLSELIPVVGWLWRRRLSGSEGFPAGFWVRPMFVEIAAGIAFAGVYWWEVCQLGHLPAVARLATTPAWGGMGWLLGIGCATRLVLLVFMTVATLIDVDEKLIPDSITVPGTLIGLALAALYPWSRLPVEDLAAPVPLTIDFLHVASPEPWPDALSAGRTSSLAVGLAAYGGWCLALLPWSWRTRRGYRMAFRIMTKRLAREAWTRWVGGLALAGVVAVTAAWWRGGPSWQGLLTALIGLAGGGGLTWMVRIVFSNVLGKEAMGFGDVTLMAMIGSFLGWQSCLIAFFLAPFSGLVLGGAQWLLTRDKVIPYGPFLCLAAFGVALAWRHCWQALSPVFALGWLIPAAVGSCLCLAAGLLWILRLFLALFDRPLPSAAGEEAGESASRAAGDSADSPEPSP